VLTSRELEECVILGQLIGRIFLEQMWLVAAYKSQQELGICEPGFVYWELPSHYKGEKA